MSRIKNISPRGVLLTALLGLSITGCVQQPVKEQAASAAVEPLPVAEAAPPEMPAGRCEEPQDLWSRARAGFALQGHQHPRVASDLAWFERHPAYLERVVERATPYMHLIVEELEQRGMPLEIALLPVVESAFQPFAYSHGRAAGLWQFVPGTGTRFGLRQTWWYDGRRDVAEATRAALNYLQYLHRHFDGDWLHALAAYNSGEGTVGRAIRKNRSRGKPTDYWSLDLPKETEGYVPKLLAISTLVANPPAHGLVLESISDQPYLASVDVGSQIDLDLAAELAAISLEEIYLYNPGFNRWATDPDGPHRLLVPVEKAERFAANLNEYPKAQRIAWKRHTVRNGDVLGALAERYRTTVSLIKSVNAIRGNTIRAGQTLVIPVARKELSRYRLSSSQRLAQLQNRERAGTRVEYQVREGDTLWDIARRYDIGVTQLAQWNGMAPRDPLKPGRKLVIWTRSEEKVSAINPADFVHPFEKTTNQRIGYTVRSGDSLARISQRFRVSIDNLKRWNRLDGEKYLQPGQRLTLYVDVKRQSGQI
jgi:membrane-bound lytic murein transglycosylase D